MVGVRHNIKATTQVRFPDAILGNNPLGRCLDGGLTSSCWDRGKAPKTKNVHKVIHCAYDILRKKGARTCQEHCFAETGANLKWSCVMVNKPLPDGGHKVRKRRTLHDPASSDDDGV